MLISGGIVATAAGIWAVSLRFGLALLMTSVRPAGSPMICTIHDTFSPVHYQGDGVLEVEPTAALKRCISTLIPLGCEDQLEPQ